MTCLSRAMQHHPIWIGNHVISILSVPSSYHLILVKDTSALSVKQKPSFPSHELTILEIKRQPSSNTSIPGPLSMRTHTRKGKNTFWCMLGCNCHLLLMRTDFLLQQRDYWDDNANAHIQCSTQIWCHLCHNLFFAAAAAVHESSCSRQRACLRSTIKWIIIHLQSQCAKTPSQWQWMSQTLNGMFSDLSQHGSLRHTTDPQVTSAKKC